MLAGIVEGELLSGMSGLVELDAALFDEFHEVIVEVDETDFIVRVYGNELFHAFSTAVGTTAAVRHDHALDVVFPDVIDFATGQLLVAVALPVKSAQSTASQPSDGTVQFSLAA